MKIKMLTFISCTGVHFQAYTYEYCRLFIALLFLLTFKVDLLHNVLGLDALFLIEDENHVVFIFCPAVFAHPHLHLRVCGDKSEEREQDKH